VAGAERPHRARQGGGGLSSAAELWGDSDYDAIVPHYEPIYDELVAALKPRRGERWLDLATGTGEIALRAAAAGAEVTAIDIAPRMVERARAKAERRGLEIDFAVGDCARLPHGDGSFDVVVSSFGMVFAVDPPAVAREVARTCAPGGRLGFTAWHELPRLTALFRRFGRTAPAVDPELWAARADELLGDAFELEVRERTWHLRGETGTAVLDFWEKTAPPTKAYLASLDPGRRADVRAALVEYWEGFRGPDGVDEPRPYVLVLGRRR
jgi:SAM-dependent methyltransferase